MVQPQPSMLMMTSYESHASILLHILLESSYLVDKRKDLMEIVVPVDVPLGVPSAFDVARTQILP